MTSSDHEAEDNPDQSVTVQWCNITETLLTHSKASLVVGKWGSRYTFHHNLYTNHEERMPEIGHWKDAVDAGDGDGNLVDFRNNVLHNWGGKECARTARSLPDAEMRFNIMYNFFKEGPDTSNGDVAFREENGNCRAYFSGNRWSGVLWTSKDKYWKKDLDSGYSMRSDYWQGAAFRSEYVKTDSAGLSVYNWKNTVVAKSGDHRWRDAVDRRSADSVDAGKGKVFDKIKSGRDYAIAELGQTAADYSADFWPFIPANSWPSGYDQDSDGMKDDWESGHLESGETTEDFKPWDDKDGDGWTNIEEFLNRTDAGVGDDPMDKEIESHVEGVL